MVEELEGAYEGSQGFFGKKSGLEVRRLRFCSSAVAALPIELLCPWLLLTYQLNRLNEVISDVKVTPKFRDIIAL